MTCFRWSVVGSTNFDNRSFALNEELNLTVYNRAFAERLEQLFHEDLKYARQITYEAWSSRGWGERFQELFTFPLRELL